MYTIVNGQKVAKGLKRVLEERRNKEWMQSVLSQHIDFKFEKCEIENKGHIPPKFHPELNPIERVWAQMKRYTRAHSITYLIHTNRSRTKTFKTIVGLHVWLSRRTCAWKGAG